MPEIGEGIAVSQARLEEDKCVFCGKSEHERPKNDIIKPTEWKRKKISGVGGRFSEEKKSIYPDGTSPTLAYVAEGHHCLAFSSYIMGAQSKPANPRDRFAVLNHYLKEKGYDPNNDSNVIDLPGRKKSGDDDPNAQYVEYAIAVEAKKPLQLHIGGHADDFMDASNVTLRDIVRPIQQHNLCKKPDDDFKKYLLKKVEDAEDEAFKNTAGVTPPWVCHPGPLKKAETFAKKMLNITTITYPKL